MKRSTMILWGLWTVCVAVIMGLTMYMVSDLQQQSVVSYEVLEAAESQLCPGETLSFSATFRSYGREIIHVVENVCDAGQEGRCYISTVNSYELAINGPKEFAATISRVLPRGTFWKPGAAYEWTHLVRNGKVNGYAVPFTIREDCQ